MSDEPPSTSETATPPSNGWRLLLRGLEVRLRFVIGLLILTGVMAGWPWLRGGWERLTARWHPHGVSAAVSGDTEFFCPMDPGVISAWPAICPICNMDLITRKKTDAVLLPEGVLARMQLSPYRVQLAGVRTVPVELLKPDSDGEAPDRFIVPMTAVVEHGADRIVYVETMPGMFDAVRVELGDRSDAGYPVLAGLRAGQRVVAAGAFLIDAESRLNPSVATQYFGANAQTAANQPPPLPQKLTTLRTPVEPLSAADQALVLQQRICPVTEAKLGSMGQPVAVTVRNRKVLLCCRGCEASLKADPEKFLARLNAPRPVTPQ
ncbi:MAG TPA: heavy metal-binding domain-containing protein [Planctomycetaceae bacterium]|nr:heavy metal-binding domain-containing protein [Planctomycetaceae bacterium]